MKLELPRGVTVYRAAGGWVCEWTTDAGGYGGTKILRCSETFAGTKRGRRRAERLAAQLEAVQS